MKTALIADDSPYIRSALRNLLTNAGLRVCGEAADGVQAIELAKALKPDIVVVDFSMPRMSGAEAALLMKQLKPRPRIIVLTLCDDAMGPPIAKSLGIEAVVSKFAGTAALNEVLRTIVMPAEQPAIAPSAAQAD